HIRPAETDVDRHDKPIPGPHVQHLRPATPRDIGERALVDRAFCQQLLDQSGHHATSHRHAAGEIGPRDRLQLAHEIQQNQPVDLSGRGAWRMGTIRVCLIGCAALLAAAGGATAQDSSGAIAGVVRARDTGTPVARVGVSVVGTRLTAESDGEGRYTISAVPPGTYHLRARLLGYAAGDTTIVVQVGQRISADFRLQPSAIELNPVVAVGYGTQRKADLTGSVSSVTGPEIATNPVDRADQAL